ncbi:metal-dependent protease of the PAD1/JAB1 superfamily [gamma proteobacterium HTCC5015]|nr:metal-dependent protease of the PAD1/JAB1 superfamily [gamma proteobacterium HTCC5015]
MTSTLEIKIKRPLAVHLMSLAQRSPDAEICGLIGMQDGELSTCYPIDNIADNPAEAFLMDPEQQAAAMRSIKDKNESLFAIYHSHPSSPPVPSERDLREVSVNDAYYLIISLNTKGVLELAAYQLQEGAVKSVELSI